MNRLIVIIMLGVIAVQCGWPVNGRVVLDHQDEFNNLIKLLQITDKFDRFTLFRPTKIYSTTKEYPSLQAFYAGENIPDTLRRVPEFMKKYKIMGIEKAASDYFLIMGGSLLSGEFGYLYVKSIPATHDSVKTLIRSRLTDNWYTFKGRK